MAGSRVLRVSCEKYKSMCFGAEDHVKRSSLRRCKDSGRRGRGGCAPGGKLHTLRISGLTVQSSPRGRSSGQCAGRQPRLFDAGGAACLGALDHLGADVLCLDANVPAV